MTRQVVCVFVPNYPTYHLEFHGPAVAYCCRRCHHHEVKRTPEPRLFDGEIFEVVILLLVGGKAMGLCGPCTVVIEEFAWLQSYVNYIHCQTSRWRATLTPSKQTNEASYPERDVNQPSFQLGIVVDLDEQRCQGGLRTAVYHVVYAVAQQHDEDVLQQ